MIVGTSVLLAIAFRESGFEQLVDRLAGADALAAGTPTLAETGIVLARVKAQYGPPDCTPHHHALFSLIESVRCPDLALCRRAV